MGKLLGMLPWYSALQDSHLSGLRSTEAGNSKAQLDSIQLHTWSRMRAGPVPGGCRRVQLQLGGPVGSEQGLLRGDAPGQGIDLHPARR